MSLVVLQPCGSVSAYQHYQDTILNKISLSDLSKFLREDDLINLGKIYPEGDTQIWGVTPGKNNANSWNLISRGDITLFSGKGKIFSSAIATYKLHNRELAQYLWGSDKQGETWEYIYFLDEVFEQNIPYSGFNKILGYSYNYVIQGFRHLDNKKSDLLINNFDLLSHTYTNPISVEEYSKLVDSDCLDTPNVTTSRDEQSFLRDKLFQRNTHATCCMCHKTFPVQFLVAAHLKKKSYSFFRREKGFQ